MNDDSVSLTLEPLQGASTTPLSELQHEVWREVAQFVRQYTSPFDQTWESYFLRSDEDSKFTAAGDGRISFHFPDFGGRHAIAARCGRHWFRSALAANFDAVSRFTQDHGWLPVNRPPELSDVVWNDERDHGWIGVGGVAREFSLRQSEEPELRTDGDGSTPEAVGDVTMEKVERARETGRCPCAMCTMLRPDAQFEAKMVESLRSGNTELAQSAIWYLRHTARPSLETALDIARLEVESLEGQTRTSFDFGRKLTADHAPEVFDAFQEEGEMRARCGLLALAGGIQLEGQLFERRYFLFVSALNEGGALSQTAAEYASLGGVAEGHESRFARALVEHLGESDNYDHHVALTLFNFFFREQTVPRFVVEALSRLSDHAAPEVRSIAEFGHKQLAGKPIQD